MNVVLDSRSRPLRDLRISVTDRCNFRCTYCMPKEVFGRDFAFLPREQLLTMLAGIDGITDVALRPRLARDPAGPLLRACPDGRLQQAV